MMALQSEVSAESNHTQHHSQGVVIYTTSVTPGGGDILLRP